MKLGFIGIGHMGEPMSANLLRAGIPLTVWNRTPGKCEALVELGASIAASVDDLFASCTTVLLMLFDAAAIDATLGRGTPAFAARVAGRIVVNLGTTSPAYSQALERDILDAPLPVVLENSFKARALVRLHAYRADHATTTAVTAPQNAGESGMWCPLPGRHGSQW